MCCGVVTIFYANKMLACFDLPNKQHFLNFTTVLPADALLLGGCGLALGRAAVRL